MTSAVQMRHSSFAGGRGLFYGRMVSPAVWNGKMTICALTVLDCNQRLIKDACAFSPAFVGTPALTIFSLSWWELCRGNSKLPPLTLARYISGMCPEHVLNRSSALAGWRNRKVFFTASDWLVCLTGGLTNSQSCGCIMTDMGTNRSQWHACFCSICSFYSTQLYSFIQPTF